MDTTEMDLATTETLSETTGANSLTGYHTKHFLCSRLSSLLAINSKTSLNPPLSVFGALPSDK